MTLVEVVGGLGLLATLLVAILLAKARYTRQAADADRRLQAVAAADALLTAWRQDPRSLPRAGSGMVAGEGRFSWRTRTIANAAISEVGATVVRLEILDDRPEAAANPAVTSVEFVVEPEEADAPTQGNDPKKPNEVHAGNRTKSHAKSLHHP
jgi:type II secretory pathway pseudopilin PulG